tara:strand:- start:711 stop:902 length:192 start_codon:yes stop_codon:yes gene_type:complete
MIKLGRVYIRNSGKRIGKEVLTQELVKIRIGSEWVDGIKYGEGLVERYVRTIEDFNKNFDALG